MTRARTVTLGAERSLHAVQGGKGPELVLIHGALVTHWDWLQGPFGAFAERFRVTAVDRPGHGFSERPRFAATPRDQAAQISEGLDALGVGRAIVCGHSMGGLVALAMAELFPDRVASLVLLSPLAFPEARPLEHGLLAPRAAPVLGPVLSAIGEATVDRPLLKIVQRLMFAPQPVPPEWEERFPEDQVLTADAMVREGEDSSAVLPFAPAGMMDLASIRVPVRILAGTADQIVDPKRHAEPLAAMLPEADLTELTGLGHMIHHVAPEAVLAAVDAAADDG